MEKIKLGDIADIYLGLTHTPKYVEKGVPFLSVKDISNGKIDFSKCHYITEEEFNTLPAGAKPQVGDMLFCRVGTIGKPIIIKEGTIKFGSFVSLGFLRITRKDYLLNYVKYWMLSNDFLQQVLKNVKGVAQINLNTSWLKKFELPQLEIKEQRRLIKKLDKIQEILDLRKKQIEELDKLIKFQFVEMFGTIYDNKNNYKIKQLKEVFSIIKDGTHSTPTYTEDKINGIKFLSAKDVASGTINWNNIKYIPVELHNELSKRVKPQKNDILLAKNGTTGICAKVDKDEVFDIYVSLALLRANEGYSIDYLVQAINNDMTKEQFDRSLKGVGVPNLHLGEIEKTKIIVPPIELQNQFAEIVKQINNQKFILEKSLKETEELQESLMNKYFG